MDRIYRGSLLKIKLKVYDVFMDLNKNLKQNIQYLENYRRSNIEIWSIVRVLFEENFHVKSNLKCLPYFQTTF